MTWREWVDVLRPTVIAPPPPARPAQPGAPLAAFLGDRAASEVAIAEATWGLRLAGADKRLYFNTQIESVRARFRDAAASRRALIPARSFEVAEGVAGEKNRARHQVTGLAGGVLLAGIWDELDGQHRVSVLTRASRGVFASLHGRMPVLVPTAQARGWLLGEDVKALVAEALERPDPPLLLDGTQV